MKGNQENLETCAEEAFERAENITEVTIEEEGHGHVEERKYELIEANLNEKMSAEWVGLQSFGRVTTHPTKESRFPSKIVLKYLFIISSHFLQPYRHKIFDRAT